MGFSKLKDLSKMGYLPENLTRARSDKYLACQQGKAHITSLVINNELIKGVIVKNPGNLVHMDQAESSTPGRSLTYSGKNNINKIFIVSMFVDSISEKVFREFQHSTSDEELISSKRRVEYNCKQSEIKIKAFRGNNGVYKAT